MNIQEHLPSRRDSIVLSLCLVLISMGLVYSYWATVLPNLDSIHARLERGEAHLSITPEAITRRGQERWLYTGPISEHALVLVQKREQAGRDSSYVHNVTELIGKPLYVLSGSSHEQRLNNLGEQIGAKLDVRLLPGDTINSEDLIAFVATDSIKYTIVDAELARLAQKYYPNTDIALEVGFLRLSIQRCIFLHPRAQYRLMTTSLRHKQVLFLGLGIS